MGDPMGIGPEIILKALSNKDLQDIARYRVFGARWALDDAARVSGLAWPPCTEIELVETPACPRIPASDHPADTSSGGAASFAWVEAAIAEVLTGKCEALVTAPISKMSWSLAGHARYPGHTELLAERCHAPRSGMLFVGPRLRVVLATVHVPLAMVPALLTTDTVLLGIELAHRACLELGTHAPGTPPRIAVAGLNPHAGEGGLLGDEDRLVIAPAIAAARAAGIDASGPHPGDTVFAAATDGRFDAVVAMYHDQGLIPVKLLDREQAVNVTAGLPIVRTSPAHGTAFDIAGRGVASAASMTAAIKLAVRLVERRRAGEAVTPPFHLPSPADDRQPAHPPC